jgi:2-dehydro-3-deoxygluconokinase
VSVSGAAGPRIACFGECMVELRRAGNHGQGLWAQGFAGDTCNTAVYLARLLGPGAPAIRYVMGVGDDLFAPALRRFWADQGLDPSLAREVQGRSTGLYLIEVDATGERHFSYWRDTSAARAYFDTAQTPLEQALDTIDLLYFSAISLAILPPAGRERLLACAAQVRGRVAGWRSTTTTGHACGPTRPRPGTPPNVRWCRPTSR